MAEKTIYLEGIDPIHILGVNNARLRLMQKMFPKVKIVARGHEIMVYGEKAEILIFQDRLLLLVDYFNRFNSLTEDQLTQLLHDDGQKYIHQAVVPEDVIIYGTGGKAIKVFTANQKSLVEEIKNNDMVFAVGPAGTGKTYTAIALAVRALKNKEIKRVILTRPAVEAGEHLGFLPGDLKEKLDPYMQPIYDALHDMIPSSKLIEYLEDGIIHIAPLAFMRGRTLGNAFVICDEAQNATRNQLKMFLTRMGKNAKFIITGDLTQIDLPDQNRSGLMQAINLLRGIEGIAVVNFDREDVIRHNLVKRIVDAYDKNNE